MSTTEPMDIVCVAPHPDDAELCCGGLLLKAKQPTDPMSQYSLQLLNWGLEDAVTLQGPWAKDKDAMLSLAHRLPALPPREVLDKLTRTQNGDVRVKARELAKMKPDEAAAVLVEALHDWMRIASPT